MKIETKKSFRYRKKLMTCRRNWINSAERKAADSRKGLAIGSRFSYYMKYQGDLLC